MPTLPAGTGRIELLRSAQFSHLSFSYPLKLLSPLPAPSAFPGLRVVYFLAYGGGLVSGDKIWIDIVVESGAALVCLTQGTSKIFKRRPRGRLATGRPMSALPSTPSPSPPDADPPPIDQNPSSAPPTKSKRDTTTQTLIATLQPSSSLYLLPSPTACFARSRYTQRQRFDLPTCGTANLVVLDWFTCGREKSTRTTAAGESEGGAMETETWAAERMEFFCEVWWGEKRGVGERVVLEDENAVEDVPKTGTSNTAEGEERPGTRDASAAPPPVPPPSPDPPAQPHRTSYSPSLLPYTLFTTLLLTGPALQPLLDHLLRLQAAEPKIMHLRQPPRLLWSVSILESRKEVIGMGRTGMVRGCGVDGEEVRQWLEKVLSGMGDLVGADVWERAMG